MMFRESSRLHITHSIQYYLLKKKNIPSGFPGGSVSERIFLRCRRPRFDPWAGKIPWKRKYILQYSCLENLIDRRAWWATVHGVTKSQTGLSD